MYTFLERTNTGEVDHSKRKAEATRDINWKGGACKRVYVNVFNLVAFRFTY